MWMSRSSLPTWSTARVKRSVIWPFPGDLHLTPCRHRACHDHKPGRHRPRRTRLAVAAGDHPPVRQHRHRRHRALVAAELSGPRTVIPAAAAPAMTCAAVSTSRPPSRNPDPYRYRSAGPVPRAASTSTTRSRSGTTGNATYSVTPGRRAPAPAAERAAELIAGYRPPSLPEAGTSLPSRMRPAAAARTRGQRPPDRLGQAHPTAHEPPASRRCTTPRSASTTCFTEAAPDGEGSAPGLAWPPDFTNRADVHVPPVPAPPACRRPSS